MSDFWWGVLALPLILAGISLAVVTICGAWMIAERWWEKRAAHSLPQEPDEPIRPNRSVVATAVLLSPQLRTIRLGWGCGLTYYRGLNRVPQKRYRSVLWEVGHIRRKDEDEREA